ncbi:MAG: alpha/beta hydrolase fold domain-containing protein [Verrucomicrobiae bacterium]|nr:alpha/beta hydrolase fold domain-containing protein [Verrucomicrobiae bacterium]
MKSLRLLLPVILLTVVAEAEEKYAPIHRLTWDEYAGTLQHWRKTYPDFVTLELRGLSGQTLPVYLLRITDRSVPDADKQVCLVTTLHCGPERSGATGALALAEWLLGDAPLAAEIRKKQIVLVMPIVNPLAFFHTDRFRNEYGVDPYTGTGPVGKLWDVKTLSLLTPERAPELVAVLSVIDEYQPEVHADLHGTGLQEYGPGQLGARQMYQGQIMTEITGGAYSNYALRPWDWRVTEAMVAAGREAGFPSDRFEADAQRTFWGPELAPLGKKLWHGAPLFYSAHYGYAKYHTMPITQEVAWEASVVARMQGLLRIGNAPWIDERAAGYPVNRIKHFVGHYVTAYGMTAAERRASRVELWNRQADFSLGFLYPQTDGRESFVVATTAAAKKIVAAEDRASLVANLRKALAGNEASVEAFLEAGPEIKLAMEQVPAQLMAAEDSQAEPIKHGFGMRVRLPYRSPRKLSVQLNGVTLAASGSDGYESWFADGFTQLQVHVPPGKAAEAGLFFLTVSYEPDEDRSTGWMPPAEVRKRFGTDKAIASPATLTDVKYGDHFRQTLDLWLAETKVPAPLVLYLHGGGWNAQDKTDIHQHLDVRQLLEAGISVASVNYRFLADASAAEVSPPLRWPLEDSARALQFVRSKAAEWNLDKNRVAGCGVSAGGCSSLWLAMHDDLASASSDDPVARESTRLVFTVTKAPQPSLDPVELIEWIPNSEYGGHAFGYPGKTRPESFAPFLKDREQHREALARFSPMANASADDPPAFLVFTKAEKPPVKGEHQGDPTHSPVLGLMLKERLDAFGVPCEIRYPFDGNPSEADLTRLLVEKLSLP